YLVVWSGDDNAFSQVDGEYEIFGQPLDAATGDFIIGRIRISDMGNPLDPNFTAYDPAVAYNGVTNEYLVVWWADDNTTPHVDGEYGIFGQRINAATGLQVGADDFRLSDMGPDGDTDFEAFFPAVAYNGAANEYLVVWNGDDTTNDEYEIYGQLLNASTGAEVGANDFRLSDMGPDGNPRVDASGSAVAYSGASNEYLVVWYGDDTTDGEYEIYGQLLNASTGAEVGANDFRLSDMGPDGDLRFQAYDPAVAYNG